MSIINSQPLIGASGQGGYFLTKSLRFRSSASAYLNRTPASASNRTTWTWSSWVKRGALGSTSIIFEAGSSGTNDTTIYFNTSNQLEFFNRISSSVTGYLVTSQVFRDPSAWYHIVAIWDSSNGTASSRMKLYINGVQVTAFATQTNPSSSENSSVNNTVLHKIGATGAPTPSGGYFDGYLAEVNFIDGQALTPSSFGETSVATGVWQPIRYTGTYGTNGFYLPFTDVATTSGSNAGLGKDFSGNGNYWTTNNISVTSGTTYDSMSDVPTLTSATAANYCVLNPLTNGSLTTLNGGNLNTTGNSASNNGNSRSSFAFSTGKWYAEFTVNGKTGTYPQYGIMQASDGQSPNNGLPQSGYGSLSNSVAYLADGTKLIANSNTAYGSSYTTGDVIGIAVDADNGAVYFSKNGTFQNSGVPTSGSSKTGAALTWTGSTVELLITIAEYNASGTSTNFGQRPFTYTPPSGFVALNTYNLPTPTIGATASSQAGKYFNPVLYSGNDSNRTITGVGFQPDFVWIKGRNAARFHNLFDAVRGAGYDLRSNSTNAEVYDNDTLTAFASDGFSLGTDVTSGRAVNYTGDTYVAWNWKANGSGVTNTAGSITSTVSANTTAGFSIVTYTGTGSASDTVGHGLGVAPSMVITKRRSSGSGAFNWMVKHSSLASNHNLLLESTGASTDVTSGFGSGGIANLTSSTTFGFLNGSSGNPNNSNTSGATYVAYCFAQVAGYSAFGSYTGNGSSDGTFVYTGFRPRYILIKRTDVANDWYIHDTATNTYNVVGNTLLPNSSAAEASYTLLDILSNGFKHRSVFLSHNTNGGTYIYMAFAENPFKFSNAR